MNQVLDEIAPLKTVRISAKRRYVEPWMTKGLEKASKTKTKLYKRCIQKDNTEQDQKQYKTYQNHYNRLIKIAKKNYYQEKCNAFKNISKKLWALINSTVNKVKHKGSIIPHIDMNGIKQTNPDRIANSFGKFYSTLGSSLVKEIVPATTSIDQYLDKIPRQLNSMRIKLTTPLEIDKIIKELPNKSCYRHDEISNKMLKSLRSAIIFPLCHIFNQSLMDGSFLDKMKWAEVLPLYKGKSMG